MTTEEKDFLSSLKRELPTRIKPDILEQWMKDHGENYLEVMIIYAVCYWNVESYKEFPDEDVAWDFVHGIPAKTIDDVVKEYYTDENRAFELLSEVVDFYNR